MGWCSYRGTQAFATYDRNRLLHSSGEVQQLIRKLLGFCTLAADVCEGVTKLLSNPDGSGLAFEGVSVPLTAVGSNSRSRATPWQCLVPSAARFKS